MEAIAEGMLTVANTVLILPLIPTLMNADAQVPRQTSVPTAACLFVIFAAYVVMGLWFAAVSAFGQAACWVTIATLRPVEE